MHSVNEKILQLLQSNNEEEQIKGLQILGAERNEEPSNSVVKYALELLKNGNSYIKETAIFALGVHWACIEAYSIIISILRNRSEDDDVLIMAAQALPRYIDYDSFDTYMTLSILSSIVLDESESNDLRGVSYVSMLIISKKITDKKTLAKK